MSSPVSPRAEAGVILEVLVSSHSEGVISNLRFQNNPASVSDFVSLTRARQPIRMSGRWCYRQFLFAERGLGIRVIVRMAANRAIDHERIGHPILNSRRNRPFFSQIPENMHGLASRRLTVHNDIKMWKRKRFAARPRIVSRRIHRISPVWFRSKSNLSPSGTCRARKARPSPVRSVCLSPNSSQKSVFPRQFTKCISQSIT